MLFYFYLSEIIKVIFRKAKLFINHILYNYGISNKLLTYTGGMEVPRIKQKDNGKGSLKLLQRLINDREDILNDQLRASIGFNQATYIEWLSPKEQEHYAEYKDQAFIEKLAIDPSLRVPLHEFWPKNGPQWDGLGKVANSVLLVEAKANIPELNSSPSSASNEKSRQLIFNSLQETKDFLQCKSTLDWRNHYYQYANRVAHLYYFRVLNDVPAYLVFIYFIGDTSVNGPSNKKEWQEAIQVMKNKMGIPEQHPLSNYIVELFFHVSEI